MITVTEEGIPYSWERIVRAIMRTGDVNNTEYGNRAKFVNGLAVELTAPKEMEWHRKDPYCSNNRIAEYKKQFQRCYSHGFAYTYMDRLTKYPPLNPEYSPEDQLEFIQRELRKGRTESRRLQAITWVPEIDADPMNKEPPCLQRIWVYPYPDKTMDVHINYRSWDIFKGYPANLNAILWMVREELLEPAGYRLRTFRALADNCHIYEPDWEDAARV